jgi:hypothetical protein
MLVSMRNAALTVIAVAGCGSLGSSDNDLDVTGDAGGQALQCTAPLACPAPSGASKHTICGQLFDLENNARFGDTTTGTTCSTMTTSGPCSLTITAYDAISLASNPAFAAPLTHGAVYVDSCGRYRIEDIDVTAIGPFVALAIDDGAAPGPGGTTVTTAIATPKIGGGATDQLETWIVEKATTDQWAATGGPPLAAGVFVPVFRAHMLGTNADPFEPQSGVKVTLNGTPVTQYYFDAASLDRTIIDATAITTGANGTALIANALIQNGLAYSGTGGLGDAACRWPSQLGMAAPNVVFVEIFRPLSVIGMQCSL